MDTEKQTPIPNQDASQIQAAIRSALLWLLIGLIVGFGVGYGFHALRSDDAEQQYIEHLLRYHNGKQSTV